MSRSPTCDNWTKCRIGGPLLRPAKGDRSLPKPSVWRCCSGEAATSGKANMCSSKSTLCKSRSRQIGPGRQRLPSWLPSAQSCGLVRRARLHRHYFGSVTGPGFSPFQLTVMWLGFGMPVALTTQGDVVAFSGGANAALSKVASSRSTWTSLVKPQTVQ